MPGSEENKKQLLTFTDPQHTGIKKRRRERKNPNYIGKLTPEGLIEKKEKKITVKQYGNALLLHNAMKDLIPLLN